MSADFLPLLHPFDSESTQRFGSDGSGTDDSRRAAVQELKATVGLALYALTALLTALHWRDVVEFHRRSPHFLMIIGVLLTGWLGSVEPSSVLTGTIQVAVGTHLAILFAITRPLRSSGLAALCNAILVPLGVLHAAGVALFFYYGFDVLTFIEGTNRFAGLAGTPNSLGGEAVLGTWAALTLMLRFRARRWNRRAAMACLCFFAFGLATAGSGTAIIASAVVILGTLGVHYGYLLTARTRVVMALALLFVCVVGAGAYASRYTTQDLVEQVAGSVGKDATLTGRTELWSTGLAAISERPVLGWGFDDHATVKADPLYDVPFNHYHNGFLDTMVAGGMVLVALLLYEMIRFLGMHFHMASYPRQCEPLLLMPLLILVLLNLSEYSVLRPLSSFYVVFQCAWCLLRVQELGVRSRRLQ